jgi:hypothetical protein
MRFTPLGVLVTSPRMLLAQVRENAGDWAGLISPEALHAIHVAVTDLLAAIRPDACAIGGLVRPHFEEGLPRTLTRTPVRVRSLRGQRREGTHT